MKKATHISTRILYRQPDRYLGWPTVARLPDATLLVAFSGGRLRHVCPFGQTLLIRSQDDGETWSEPEIINDSPLDDRDAGLLVTATGAVLLTWFTSDLFARKFERYIKLESPEVEAAWMERVRSVSPDVLNAHLGNWVRRSLDGGQTWESPKRLLASSPHGPALLRNGDLIQVGWQHADLERRLIVERSVDHGQTWHQLSLIQSPGCLGPGGYLGEPHVVEAADGRLVAMFRSVVHQPGVSSAGKLPLFLHQSDSFDGGTSWSIPRPTPIWGYPPHLLRLADSSLLVSYGHRRDPMGQRCCLSRDHGQTWEIQNTIQFPCAPDADHGYPSTVELAPGEFLTVYYQIHPPDTFPSLMATRWKLPSNKA